MISITTHNSKNEMMEPITELVDVKIREREMITNPQRTTSKSEVGCSVGEGKIFNRTTPTPRKAKTII